jgi:hypothetical protein
MEGEKQEAGYRHRPFEGAEEGFEETLLTSPNPNIQFAVGCIEVSFYIDRLADAVTHSRHNANYFGRSRATPKILARIIPQCEVPNRQPQNETMKSSRGSVRRPTCVRDFNPETIDLLRDVLERTWGQLPPDRKSNLTKSDVTAKILKRAADGERDPVMRSIQL